MASSASLTTTHLPRLRTELQDWTAKQKPTNGFSVPLAEIGNAVSASTNTKAGKDVIVAFRTRPPLENEAENKFKASDAYGAFRKGGEENQAPVEPAAEFCSGISVASAEPGVFVAHVPGFKVRFSLRLLI